MKTTSTSTTMGSKNPVEQPANSVWEDSSQIIFVPLADDPEVRQRRIAEAAYFRAEARGFTTGYEWDDWLVAEAEYDPRVHHADLDSGQR